MGVVYYDNSLWSGISFHKWLIYPICLNDMHDMPFRWALIVLIVTITWYETINSEYATQHSSIQLLLSKYSPETIFISYFTQRHVSLHINCFRALNCTLLCSKVNNQQHKFKFSFQNSGSWNIIPQRISFSLSYLAH